HGAGDVRAVVDGKKCPVAFTRLTEHLQRGDLLQGVQPPVPELDDVHTSGKGRVGELGEVTLLGPGIGAQVQKGCVQALTQAGSMTGPHPFHPRRVHPRGRHADKVHIVPERREEAPSRASAYDRGSGVPRHGPRADLTPDPRTSCARCRGEPHSANPWARRRTSVPRFSRMAWMGVPGRESSGVNSQRRASSWEKPESLSRTRVPGRPLTKSLPFKNAAGTDNSPLRTTPIMRFSRMSCLMWLGLTLSGCAASSRGSHVPTRVSMSLCVTFPSCHTPTPSSSYLPGDLVLERTGGAGWTRLRWELGAPDRTNLTRIMPA